MLSLMQMLLSTVQWAKSKKVAKDAVAYGRSLLDILLTKSEQKQLLLYSSKKSIKPALNRDKVDLLIGK